MGHYASEMDLNNDDQKIEQLKKEGWTLVPVFFSPKHNNAFRHAYNIRELNYDYYISLEDLNRLKNDIKNWLK